MLVCVRKEIIYTRRVKCDIGKMMEFGIMEMWKKMEYGLENRTYVGTHVFGRQVRNEVGM